MLRRLIPPVLVLVLVAGLFSVARLPSASAEERSKLASRFAFTELPIALPPGLPERTVRQVNPRYEHIRSWISSVGAGVALNDLDGRGGANDLCLVDPRSDAVIVTPAPESGATYAPFVLDPAPLPMGSAIAPMGCTPGDFNLDGRMDLLVYYWGRTPVLFMQRAGVTELTLAAYHPVELIPQLTSGPAYRGPLWNTNAVAVADFDGDGKPDIGIFNYFPDSQVLDPQGLPHVQMNHSMSHAHNAGGAHFLRWTGATTGDAPSVSYEEQKAGDPAYFTGWTLGAGSADLDGDLLPELYLANDFGQDRFFHNRSTPGQIRFALVEGRRTPITPKSLVLGHDSFKGMSIDFADLEGRGRFDAFVSNITESWGLEESNFLWYNTAETPEQAREMLNRGEAPYRNVAGRKNIAWVGWGWDTKMADFDNSGKLAVVQATGFVKGTINRFNWLQELAIANDLLLSDPYMWPKAEPGDDIAGENTLAFWVREDNGRYVDIGKELGLSPPIPTRGVAVGDTNGDGAQDFAVARQWGPPAFFRNDKPGDGNFLGLRLNRPTLSGDGTSPAYGAQVRITTADGRTQLAQLDGGGGHSGKRSFDVFFGLGDAGDRPVKAELCWRDLNGAMHKQTLDLTAGWHDLMLTSQAEELTKR
ncbi:CRTAC1 family protein [Micromonospora sp. NPDC048871]|uniref:CRTAC1 family protein n=1 Tax=unclassified Micromonospora TaxID=2617518 RepID=UPI002E1571BC|nr:CRTAC1 family protein [Micromonospora sp. NBC_01739]